MKEEIKKLYPQRVFHYFLEISKIPRGSGNEKQVSDYLVNFAKEHGLYVYQDEFHNVLIRKPATKGYEKYKPIALQGHMDMVCDKNLDVEFDFLTQGIDVKVKDGFLVANGTTLGADNGISMGMTLAILESKELKHPEIEVLLTSDEEAGMTGAINFDISKLKSDILVNIDSEEYGSIFVSSAGSILVEETLELDKIENNSKKTYEISIKGLNGGHSGADIHENRANAVKLIAELFNMLKVEFPFYLVDIKSGAKNNTIPREAFIKIATNYTDLEMSELLEYILESIKYRYKDYEDNIRLEIKELENSKECLSIEYTNKVLEYISNHPVGVIKKSNEIKGLIQTSLNMGIVRIEDNILKVNSLVRSQVIKEQEDIANYIVKYANYYGLKASITDKGNPWEYKKDSKIRDYFVKVFEEQIGYKPNITAIHAGLECGIFKDKNPKLDVISVGPDIKNPHTPDERMSIEAVAKTWDYLVKILEDYNID